MQFSEHDLRHGERSRPLGPRFQTARFRHGLADSGPLFGVVGECHRRTARQHVLAVRIDECDGNPIHRSAAHQPQRAHRLAPNPAVMQFARAICGNPTAPRAPTQPAIRNRDRKMMTETPKSQFLATLTERGFIHQTSDFAGLDKLASEGKIVAYVGYDCTAPSLHIGHLFSIMMLHWLQQTGAGKPIALMGGGTTRVGDPSGQRRDAPAALHRGDRRQQGRHQAGLRQIPEIRRRRRPTRSWSTMPSGWRR